MGIKGKTELNVRDFDRETVEIMLLQALKMAEDIGVEWELDHGSPGLRDGFRELAICLDYLKRYCEGKL